MARPLKRRCPSCRFFSESYCYRFPPVPLSVSVKDGYGSVYQEVHFHQPVVTDNEWCGEHKFDRVKFAELVLLEKNNG